MIENITTFLDYVYRNCSSGYLTLSAIHPSKRLPTPSRHIPISDIQAVCAALKDLQRANEQGWGAYFSAALRKRQLDRWHRGGYGDLLILPALFADLDVPPQQGLMRLRNFYPPPSACVASGAGLHAYWLIEPTQDFATANRLLAALAKRLGGDPMGSTGAMRLPNTVNTKPYLHQPRCTVLDMHPERRYKLCDFAHLLPQRPIQSILTPPTMLNRDLIQQVIDILLRNFDGFVQKNGWIGCLCPYPHARDSPGKHFAYVESKSKSRDGKKDYLRSLAIEIRLPRVTLEYLAYGAAVGTRNTTLFAAACQFRDAQYSLADAEALLVARFLADGQPNEHPRSLECEARRTIRSAYSRTPRRPVQSQQKR